MNEMNKLREALKSHGIAWIDNSDTLFTRTVFVVNDTEFSVICGWYSYGGQAGLLESCPPIHDNITDDTVEGWLSADEIIDALIKTNGKR